MSQAEIKHGNYRKDAQSSRPFPCPHPGCNHAAKEKSHLTLHLKTHSSQPRKFSCPHLNCNYSANQKGILNYHIRTHTGEKPHVCQFESCSYATTTRADLVRHSRTHTKERPFKCPEPNCKFVGAQLSHLTRHQLSHEPKEGEVRPSFSCPLCEYSSKIFVNLSRHIKRHTLEKFFKCDEPNCNFEAKTTSEIKLHKVIHSDETPFACSVESCEYRSKSQSNFSTHLKIHSEERQYKCELCPFRGKTIRAVRSHIKNVHSDLDLLPFKCKNPQCNSAFKTKDHLTRHILTHGGEKKYSCPFLDCAYKAARADMVKAHQKRHETE